MEKSTIAYKAIILALAIHVAVLGVLYITNPIAHGEVPGLNDVVQEEIDMEFISEEQLEVLQEEQNKIPNYLEERLKNLVVNQSSEMTSKEVSYSKSTNEQLSDDKYNELKAFEESLFEELQKDKASNTANGDAAKEKIEAYEKSKNLWSDEEKSYSGLATVSYKINGKHRSQRELPIPSYKCKVSGTVTVDISLNKSGTILEASINDMLTTTSNECLLEEALKYAKKSSFVSALDVPRKQTGTITYVYSAQ